MAIQRQQVSHARSVGHSLLYWNVLVPNSEVVGVHKVPLKVNRESLAVFAARAISANSFCGTWTHHCQTSTRVNLGSNLRLEKSLSIIYNTFSVFTFDQTSMAAALNKIAGNSPSRQNPSEIETSIANALYELETNIPDMRSALRPLQFVSAREV